MHWPQSESAQLYTQYVRRRCDWVKTERSAIRVPCSMYMCGPKYLLGGWHWVYISWSWRMENGICSAFCKRWGVVVVKGPVGYSWTWEQELDANSGRVLGLGSNTHTNITSDGFEFRVWGISVPTNANLRFDGCFCLVLVLLHGINYVRIRSGCIALSFNFLFKDVN